MSANGIEVHTSSAARVQADTAAMGAEDAERIYRNTTSRTSAILSARANDRASAAAAGYRGKSKLFSGLVSGAATLTGGAAEFGKRKPS